jgi:hypothetical protein
MPPRVGEGTAGTLGRVGAGTLPAEPMGLLGIGAVGALTTGGLGAGSVGTVTTGGFGSGSGGTVTTGGLGAGSVGTVTTGGFGSGSGGTVIVGTSGTEVVGIVIAILGVVCTPTPESNSAPACKGAAKTPKPTRNPASENARARRPLIFTGYAIPLSRGVWLTPQYASYPNLAQIMRGSSVWLLAQLVERRPSTGGRLIETRGGHSPTHASLPRPVRPSLFLARARIGA